MSFTRYAVRRTVFAGLSAAVVLSTLFCVFAFVPAPTPGTAIGGRPPGVPSDGSIPLSVRYLDWMVGFLTLEWGEVRASPAIAILDAERVPDGVAPLVGQRLLFTAVYAVPGLLGAILFGLLVGYDSATRAGTVRDRLVRLVTYLGFAVPTVVVAVVALRIGLRDFGVLSPALPDTSTEPWTPYNVVRLATPAAITAVTLVGATARHARSESRERLDTTAIRLVRAKGGGYLTVARHVLRGAAAQLVSAVVAETLGVFLLVAIMIEIVFDVGGFGRLLLFAAVERQPTLVAAVTFVTALLGIGGNLLADLLRAAIDPRTVE